jgi:hypothetical protein
VTVVLIEGALNTLAAYLEAGMPAKIAELNTRYGDDVNLEDIKTWYRGNLPSVFPEFPCAAVVGMSCAPPRVTHGNTVKVDSAIALVVFDAWADEQERFKRLARYMVAIIELLLADTTAGYLTYIESAYEFSGFIEKGQFIQAVSLPIRVESYE